MKRRAVALLLAGAAAAHGQGVRIEAEEPRAFGYQVGDLVHRRVVAHAAAGWTLDPASLPRPGGRGRALELRHITHRDSSEGSGRRHEIDLEYQVFLAPAAVRTLEIASWRLRFEGPGRAEEALVEAWPVTVAPLAPVEAPARRGLGDLQPDAPPPQVSTQHWQQRLAAAAGLALLLSAGLAVAYAGPPWRAARNRPFGRAWRALKSLPAQAGADAWQQACRQLHEALNRTAGEVVFAGGIDRFIAEHPAYAAQRDDLARFLDLTSRQFFGGAAREPGDAAWLVALARRLHDAERGLA